MTHHADNVADTRARFARDTAQHVMEVVLDQGVHRHLRFRRPDRTFTYGFDIVTWPGYLAISGDMGGSIFTRLPDMFEFFRTERGKPGELAINVSYWAEKLHANDGAAKRFDRDVFQAALRQRILDAYDDVENDMRDERDRLLEHVEHESACENEYEAMDWACSFKPDPGDFPLLRDFRFVDFWETTITDYDTHLIWRMLAIAHAVKAYDEHKAVPPPAWNCGRCGHRNPAAEQQCERCFAGERNA